MISDADLLAYIRPATTDDLPTLRRLEKAAIAFIEKKTGRYFGVAGEITESLQWRGWPMRLANEPLDGITTFESWDGSAFSSVDSTSYYFDYPFIFLQSSRSTWTPLTMPARYQATYDAGYSSTGDDENETTAPEDVKQAVLLLVGHWFENREAVVVGDSATGELPLAVSALLNGHTRVAV